LDGPLKGASLAQPTGMTTDGKKLYFVDSESSSVRSADFNPMGNVRTIVGKNLFAFGDQDGEGGSVLLQHPLGVVFRQGYVYVADTYNNKIKRINPMGQSCETLFGEGTEGLRDGAGHQALFNEPAGLSIAKDRLYIADTNNHVIRVADLKTRHVGTVQVKNAESLWPEAAADVEPEPRRLAVQAIKPGTATLTITLGLPRGYKLSPGAPSFVTVTAPAGGALTLGETGEQTFKMPQFPLTVPLKAAEGSGSVQTSYAIYYCTAQNEGLCYFDGADVLLPVAIRNDAAARDLRLPLNLNLH